MDWHMEHLKKKKTELANIWNTVVANQVKCHQRTKELDHSIVLFISKE
jgi:hypothetical protein